ncbi:MAG: hypothetical protein PHY12_08990 [Eubacteriales bacterium]|nr:hypothetical protein [Eubacteriales bacterium]
MMILTLLLLTAPALADDAGVMTEQELNAWTQGVLERAGEPENAPIGEDALTESGYAFLYDEATVYRETADEQSAVLGFSIADENALTPRGVSLNGDANALLDAFAWQNHDLRGENGFVPLYVMDRLPEAAYWAFAQVDENGLTSVQCGVHAKLGDETYTDEGVRYTVEKGRVTSIAVYGLGSRITLAEARSNVNAVSSGALRPAASAAEPLGPDDLRVGNVECLTLTEAGAKQLFGTAQTETWTPDDNGEWLLTTKREGIALVYAADPNKRNPRLESLAVTSGELAGPRGLRCGMTMESALALFQSDGQGRKAGDAWLLYGDGLNPPYAALMSENGGTAALYACRTERGGTALTAWLRLAFQQNTLTEWSLYTTP